MSSARFNRLVRDAYINKNFSAAIDAYNEYQDSACLHPYWQEILDQHTQTKRKILVNCGKCFHCMQTKINEWVTRMYAHAEDFKNVYFVTLTYRSFTNKDLQLNKLIMSRLAQAVWHYDAYNSTRHLSYNPCILCKDHYQKFLKRLRKNTGLNDLTYVLSGEYGHDYGRPHFHMILFTNGTLTKQDIARAWSVCLFRKNDGTFIIRTNQKNNGVAYDFPIGRVDFHDLVTNGTFNTTAKIRVDGTYMNAANCFSYVAKYVVKREGNVMRVNLAYDGLFHRHAFVKLFNNEVPFSIAKDYLLEHGYLKSQAEDIYNKQLKHLTYEKIIFEPSSAIFADSLQREKLHEQNHFQWTEELLPQVHYEFCHRFRPFCEFSRATPIGSVYAKRNIQEFTQDVYTKPILQDTCFVVPSYFRRKAQDYLYGLRKVRKTMSNKSFVLTGLVDLQRRLEDANSGVHPMREYLHDTDDYQTIKFALQDDFHPFVDKYSGERILLHNGYAQHFKFDRSTKSYRLTKYMLVADWIRYWCDSLSREFVRHEQQLVRSKSNLKDRDAALCILTDIGLDSTNLRESYESRQKLLYEHHQKLYHSVHNSAE